MLQETYKSGSPLIAEHQPPLITGRRDSRGMGKRFPMYDSADAGAGRTGKMRQVQYRLVASEAGWILREDKVTTF